MMKNYSYIPVIAAFTFLNIGAINSAYAEKISLNNDAAICDWAISSVKPSVRFDENILENLQQAQPFFTKEGFASYNRAVMRSGSVESALKDKISTSAELIENTPAQISNIFTKDNLKHRIVLVPANLVYHHTKENKYKKNPVRIALTIAQSSELGNPQGVGITQWIAGGENYQGYAGLENEGKDINYKECNMRSS